MIRHRDGGTRRSDATGFPSSVPDLARSLRRVRTRQGLRLEDVSARTGLPLAQLEALEGGTVDRIPDRVATLKTLRGYADFLGMSGDRFVLILVEHWPATPTVPPPIVAVHGTSGAIPMTGSPTTMTPTVAAVPTAVAVAGVHSGTAQVPAVVVDPAPTGETMMVPSLGPMADTGVTAAVPGAHHRAAAHRRSGAPVALRVLVGVVVLAIVVGVAGLLIHRFQPKWLQSIGITHADHPTSSTTVPHHAATSTTVAPQRAAAFSLVTSDATSASFDVRAPTFLVRVIATGNPSWVQATTPGQTTPLYAGILAAGQSKDFLVQQSLTVEVGSSAAHLFVSVGKKNVGFYLPSAAPFTMTFQSVT